VKDYTAHQDLILQLVEAIVAKRRCFVQYQAPGRPAPRVFVSSRTASSPSRSPLLRRQGTYHDSLMSLAIDRFHRWRSPRSRSPVDDVRPQEIQIRSLWGSLGTPMTRVLCFRPHQAPYVRNGSGIPIPAPPGPPRRRLELTFHAGRHSRSPADLAGRCGEVVRPGRLVEEVRRSCRAPPRNLKSLALRQDAQRSGIIHRTLTVGASSGTTSTIHLNAIVRNAGTLGRLGTNSRPA